MINWLIGIVIFLYAGWLLLKNIQKAKKGKCPSCSSGRSCGKEKCQCH